MRKTECKLADLRLDLRNPRIRSAEREKAALARIVLDQRTKLANLAEDIVDFGLSPTKRLMVIPYNGNIDYTVLDGNRRVTSLRILQNPHLLDDIAISPSLRARFDRLNKKFTMNTVEPISITVFDTREDAQHWIELEHNGQNEGRGVVQWNTLVAARFRENRLGALAIELVLQEYNFPDETKEQIEGGRYLTTLERVLVNKTTQDQLEIVVKRKALEKYSDHGLSYLKQIILDLSSGEKKVDNLKNRRLIERYVSELTGGKTPGKPKNDPPKLKPKPGTKPPVARPRRFVVPGSACSSLSAGRAHNVLHELKTLEVEKFPNSISILLRLFLEISATQYVDKKRLPKTYIDKKDPTNLDGSEKRKKKTVAQIVTLTIDHIIGTEKYDNYSLMGVKRSIR